jgi:predicted ATPase
MEPFVRSIRVRRGEGCPFTIPALAGPEGGSQNYGVSTRDSHSPLHQAVTLVRGARRPRTGFFLRAESFYNVASTVLSFVGTDGSE